MKVASIISTKGGEGKTTIAANLGGILADAGLRVLLIDLDIQPTLSSYYELQTIAPAGIYELIAFNERSLERLISNTSVHNLDLIFSNDEMGQLNTLLLHAADGRLRLKNLLPHFHHQFDLVLIDTQGARSVLLEMAILASDMVISPVTPAILSAREFRRGTLQLLSDISPYQYLGIQPPPVNMLINRIPPVSVNSRLVQSTLREIFIDQINIHVLSTDIPQLEVYPKAAFKRQPVHRIEKSKRKERLSPSAMQTMSSLAIELFPEWRYDIESVSRRAGLL